MSFSTAAKKSSSSDSVGILRGGAGDRTQRDLVLVICSSSSSVASRPYLLLFTIVAPLQGLWFYQTAFVLYGPMMPSGCKLRENSVTCDSIDSEVWGESLANIRLFVAVLVVLVGTVTSYGFAASRYGNSEVKNLHAIQAELDQDLSSVAIFCGDSGNVLAA
ncbi:hypothetical protein D0Y65_021939 [Glycine soja]|uniref:Uncharacterized protein n=1 Tax=Glycine soja TaxID=3848 RepID=A0A445JLB8_GLYSO|nr:hypothetical protein D0Y65_021939 [Glycine soja]